MSSSILYTVNSSKTKKVAEFRNSWGTAPPLWGYICKEFLNQDAHDWMFHSQKIWDLMQSQEFPYSWKVVLGFTCDGAICPKDRVEELSRFLKQIYKILKAYNPPDYSNHWSAIADELLKIKFEDDDLGVALTSTTVSDLWIGWDPSEEDVLIWDIFTNKDYDTTVYFLQNCTSGFLGNSPVFWSKKGGYTQWIDDAQTFTKEKAQEIINSSKGSHEWKLWDVFDVKSVAKLTVDMQDLQSM